jgi:histidinol-phosphate aminotransferase
MISPDDGAVRRWIRPEIRSLTAYQVPDAEGMIKLDAMENPYVWPQGMVEEWLERLRRVPVNRYPDPRATHLTATLRETMGIPGQISVLLGNGSDELIQLVLTALAGPARVVVSPEPGFVMYRLIALHAGLDYVAVPLLTEDFGLDRAAMLAAIETHQPAVVFLAYPNNPTGNLFAAADVEAVIEAAPGLVVVDEAYHPFAGATYMDRLGHYPNLLVMRTVSKLGLAGLRLGLLAGPPAWIREIDKVRLPYNVNVLTQASADFALHHGAVLAKQTAQICRDRDQLSTALGGIRGIRAYGSRANFILFRVPRGQAVRVHAGLRARGVLIKDLSAAGGSLQDCLRVTVGRPDENAAFIAALEAVMGAD